MAQERANEANALASGKSSRKTSKKGEKSEKKQRKVYETHDQWCEARKKQIVVWYGNNKRGPSERKTKVEFALAPITAPRKLTDEQTYSTLFYASRIKPHVEAYLLQNPTEKASLVSVRARFAKLLFLKEEGWVKDAVAKEMEKAEVKKRELKEVSEFLAAGETVNVARMGPMEFARGIHSITEVAKAFLTSLAGATGWSWSLIGGGPDPDKENGGIRTVAHHFGANPAGHCFDEAHPEFTEVVKLFKIFCHSIYPEEERIRRAISVSSAKATNQEAVIKSGRLDGVLMFTAQPSGTKDKAGPSRVAGSGLEGDVGGSKPSDSGEKEVDVGGSKPSDLGEREGDVGGSRPSDSGEKEVDVGGSKPSDLGEREGDVGGSRPSDSGEKEDNVGGSKPSESGEKEGNVDSLETGEREISVNFGGPYDLGDVSGYTDEAGGGDAAGLPPVNEEEYDIASGLLPVDGEEYSDGATDLGGTMDSDTPREPFGWGVLTSGQLVDGNLSMHQYQLRVLHAESELALARKAAAEADLLTVSMPPPGGNMGEEFDLGETGYATINGRLSGGGDMLEHGASNPGYKDPTSTHLNPYGTTAGVEPVHTGFGTNAWVVPQTQPHPSSSMQRSVFNFPGPQSPVRSVQLPPPPSPPPPPPPAGFGNPRANPLVDPAAPAHPPEQDPTKKPARTPDPAVNPPAVAPPAVDPPAVDPPAVDPPAVDPPAVDPPAINPSAPPPKKNPNKRLPAPPALDAQPREKRVRKTVRAIPKWVEDALGYLMTASPLPEWSQCVLLWYNLECHSASTETGSRLGCADVRPVELSRWFGSKHRDYTSDFMPPLANIEQFAKSWIDWWNKMQPKVRRSTSGMPLPLDEGMTGAMGVLQKTGPSGLVVLMIGLSWWVPRGAARRKQWLDAVADVTRVLRLFAVVPE